MKLILGTVQFGLNYGINNSSGKISKDESFKIFNYAFNHGITTLDSAESYGNAHEIIGEFHRKNPNKIFKIITKLPNEIDVEISKKVDKYLNDLAVDKLDVLMFHSYDSYVNNMKKFDVLKDLKNKNKIKQIGVSVYTNREIEKLLSNYDVDIIQLPFNLLDNASQRQKILNKAKLVGKKIHSRSALLQGLFFKKIEDENLIVNSLRSYLNKIMNISKNYNLSISELALSYCLNQKYIDNVLIGVDSIDHLIDNLKCLKIKIDKKLINEINSISVKNSNLLNPSLWT